MSLLHRCQLGITAAIVPMFRPQASADKKTPAICLVANLVAVRCALTPDSKSRHEDLRPSISNVAIHEVSDMVFSRRSCISRYLSSACTVAAKDITAATVAQRIHPATGLTAGDFQQLLSPWLTTEGTVQRYPCTLAFSLLFIHGSEM